MGEKRRSTAAFLKANPVCCFCGGSAAATTVDHQPARSLFDRREWPEGYAFPACENCNQETKNFENQLALLVRIDLRREDDPQRRADFQKYLGAMRNNFPDLLRVLSTNEKRKFFKQEGLEKPAGVALGELRMVGMSADQAERAIETVFKKIAKALHYKHTGFIVPPHADIWLRWFTNAYLFKAREQHFEDFVAALPAGPPLVRNGRDLSDQFAYRYGRQPDNLVSAYSFVFRNSLVGFVIINAEPDAAAG